MTQVAVPGWTQLSSAPPVLVREYSFGPGRATAVAVRLPSGRWLILSPPATVQPAEAAAFTAAGGVAALVANNGAHHLGLGPWGQAFPEAVSYALPRAAARIRGKSAQAGQLAPVESLLPLLGEQVALLAMDGDKIGDLLLRVRSERGPILYVSDMVANINQRPKNPLFRLIFWLTDSAPGLKLFKIFFTFFVRDKAAARAFLVRELEANPPAVLVPAHGDVVERADVGPSLLAMLRA